MEPELTTRYPNIAPWVEDHSGLIEIGYRYDTPYSSFIRAIEAGGTVVHGQDEYDSFEAALEDLDDALAEALAELYDE